MIATYSTSVTATGGRNGIVRSDDGLLDLALAMPVELGGSGGATNPEQLFAAGYAACFQNAVIYVARRDCQVSEDAVSVVGKVAMVPNGAGGFVLDIALDIEIAGLDQARAEAVVAIAHAACPYSNAVKGNIDVAISVSVC